MPGPDASRTAPPALAEPAVSSLASRYRRIRAASLALAAPLTPEDCQVQSMPDASPVKWHLAHTTWFFETFVLEAREPGFRPFDAGFRVLFNSYYQGVGARHPRPQRGLLTRPTLRAVLDFRRDVDARMHALLARPVDPPLEALVELGLQHEQQHQELILTDLKHLLSCHPAPAAYARAAPPAQGPAQPMGWIRHDGGLVEIGHDPARDGPFCFDNETPRHRTWLEVFEIGSRPVSCAEHLAFIDDGGYRRPELWLSMGWDWVQAGAREAPLYWQREAAGWMQHTLQGRLAIDPNSPVCHLSYFEADAHARWAGARLPTEAEWETMARRHADPARGHYAEDGGFHPRPAPRPAAQGPIQMYGDVWEWTSSAYAPYPRYRPWPGAVGEYNGKFMCNQYVLRGGSCATPAGHVRASYRNFFPPEAQWQFSGLRLARDA